VCGINRLQKEKVGKGLELLVLGIGNFIVVLEFGFIGVNIKTTINNQ